MRPPEELIFPSNPEEFYRLRDDRTNRCVASRNYQSVGTTVSIDSGVVGTASGQAMVLTTCNLLSRWCREVDVVWPAAAAGIPSHCGRGLLKDVVIQTMYDADPFGNFRISDHATLKEPISLHIGPVPPKIRPTVAIDAGGWTASLGSSNGQIPAKFRDANIIGAVGAACFGVA